MVCRAEALFALLLVMDQVIRVLDVMVLHSLLVSTQLAC